MKVEDISMLQRLNSSVYIGRMDGLVMKFSYNTPPSILLKIDNFIPISIAKNPAETLVSGMYGNDDCIIRKRTVDGKLYKYDENVRFFIDNYFVNDDFCLCKLQPSGAKNLMPLDLLDSTPLVYDVDTYHHSLLAIARHGTIYTIDCTNHSSYYALTFSTSNGEIHQKMQNFLDKREDNIGNTDKKIGVIEVKYGDPDEDEELLAENKYFDEIIDSRLPIRAHDPQCHITALKLVNINSDDSPLVVSALDNHITVHDFSTHKKLYDSGWIDTCVYCCAHVNNKMIFGGFNGGVAMLDLDDFKLQEFKLPINSSLFYVDASDNLAAFYTSDNSVVIVDLNTMKIYDVFAPTVKLRKICILGKNLFMLNDDLELTIEEL